MLEILAYSEYVGLTHYIKWWTENSQKYISAKTHIAAFYFLTVAIANISFKKSLP